MLLNSAMQKNYSQILIAGDLNYKYINWLDIPTNISIEYLASLFHEIIKYLYLTQHITQPTRFCHNQQDILLDLIFTNE